MSNVKRYAISLVLALLSLLIFVVGVLALTVWNPAQQISATGQTDQPYMMTRTGVLSLYNEDVTVTVSAPEPSQKVWVAFGSEQDIAGWLADESYANVSGLLDLHTLRFSEFGSQSGEIGQSGAATQLDQSGQSGEDSAVTDEAQSAGETAAAEESSVEDAQSGASVVDPIDSDMWTDLRGGTGTLTLHPSADQAGQALLLATDGVGPAPSLTLTWDYPRANILAWVAFVLAALILVLAAITGWVVFRSQKRRRDRAQQLREVETADVTETAIIPVMTLEAEIAEDADDVSEADTGGAEDVDEEQRDQAPADVTPAEEPAQEEAQSESPSVSVPEAQEVAVPEPQVFPTLSESETGLPAFPKRRDLRTTTTRVSTGIPQLPPTARSTRTEDVTAAETDGPSTQKLQGGAVFPTRRALREAQEQGIERIVVEGREFPTGEIPVVQKSAADEAAEVLSKRASGGFRWGRAFSNKKDSDQKEDGE